MNLSPHFTLEEARKSQTAERRGIDNTPSDDVIPNLQMTALEVLEPVRQYFNRPFSPSSWYRSYKLNQAIGGSPSSQHKTGHAVDFEVPGVDNITLAKWIRDNLDFNQLILECYHPGRPHSGWVHVSYVQGGNTGEVLTYSDGMYTHGLQI